LKALFRRWVANARQPLVLDSLRDPAFGESTCQCPLHAALGAAKSVLVHGVRDERGECDSLYIALHSEPIAKGCLSGCFRGAHCFLIDSLVMQIDMAARKVAALPLRATASAGTPEGACAKLSAREREIMEWICKGKTNFETGMILDISSFTVKNHVQRIFQKIGANNRVHAATLYREHCANQEEGARA
jgi:DNA-binding CsgD family transcriptional regulator